MGDEALRALEYAGPRRAERTRRHLSADLWLLILCVLYGFGNAAAVAASLRPLDRLSPFDVLAGFAGLLPALFLSLVLAFHFAARPRLYTTAALVRFALFLLVSAAVNVWVRAELAGRL